MGHVAAGLRLGRRGSASAVRAVGAPRDLPTQPDPGRGPMRFGGRHPRVDPRGPRRQRERPDVRARPGSRRDRPRRRGLRVASRHVGLGGVPEPAPSDPRSTRWHLPDRTSAARRDVGRRRRRRPALHRLGAGGRGSHRARAGSRRSHGRERCRTRDRCRVARGRALGPGVDARRPRFGARRPVPVREPGADRADRPLGDAGERIRAGHAAQPAPLPGAQPDRRRPVPCHRGGRGREGERLADHGRTRDGVRA